MPAPAATFPRDYAALAAALAAINLPADRQERMRIVIDAMWEALSPTGVSWIGFYLAGDTDMTLGPSRDKPACSPIGLHGACGRASLSRRSLIVRDVTALGDNYVACDPRDKSEVVVPMFDESGRCYAVLDADSHAVAAFDAFDARALEHVLQSAGLSMHDTALEIDLT